MAPSICDWHILSLAHIVVICRLVYELNIQPTLRAAGNIGFCVPLISGMAQQTNISQPACRQAGQQRLWADGILIPSRINRDSKPCPLSAILDTPQFPKKSCKLVIQFWQMSKEEIKYEIGVNNIFEINYCKGKINKIMNKSKFKYT